jgi:hypothetical protein
MPRSFIAFCDGLCGTASKPGGGGGSAPDEDWPAVLQNVAADNTSIQPIFDVIGVSPL